MFLRNNHRQDDVRTLRDRLDVVRRVDPDGREGWRDHQRQRYLERRLRDARKGG
jgi:hypothetical protein